MTELLLGKIIKSIGLILCQSGRTPQRITAVFQFFNPGVMAGSQIVRTDRQTFSQQSLPFYIPVTGYAGIGSMPAVILAGEIINHILLKLFPEIHYIKRDVKSSCNSSGIFHRAQSAAAAVLFHGTGVFFLPDLHGNAGNIIPLLFQKIGCNGGVHSSGHSYDHSAH